MKNDDKRGKIKEVLDEYNKLSEEEKNIINELAFELVSTEYNSEYYSHSIQSVLPLLAFDQENQDMYVVRSKELSDEYKEIIKKLTSRIVNNGEADLDLSKLLIEKITNIKNSYDENITDNCAIDYIVDEIISIYINNIEVLSQIKSKKIKMVESINDYIKRLNIYLIALSKALQLIDAESEYNLLKNITIDKTLAEKREQIFQTFYHVYDLIEFYKKEASKLSGQIQNLSLIIFGEESKLNKIKISYTYLLREAYHLYKVNSAIKANEIIDDSLNLLPDFDSQAYVPNEEKPKEELPALLEEKVLEESVADVVKAMEESVKRYIGSIIKQDTNKKSHSTGNIMTDMILFNEKALYNFGAGRKLKTNWIKFK